MATQIPLLSLTKPIAATMASSQFYAVALNSSDQWAVASVKGQRVSGIMQENPATGNASARCFGVSKAVIGATCDEGDPLTVDSSGRVIPANDVDEYVLGEALSAATSAGEIITVMLTHAGSIPAFVGQETNTSSADYSSAGQYTAVKQHSVAGQIVQCSSAGERAYGILQNAPDTGEEAEVCTGGQCTGLAGTGNLTAGQAFTTASDGSLIAATGAAVVLGWAEEAITDGSTGTVFFASSGIATVAGAALASAKLWVGSGSGLAAAVTMSGDVTNDNAGVQTIGAKKVAAAKMYSAAQGTIFRTDAANAVSELSLADGKVGIGDGTDVAAVSIKAAGTMLHGNGTTGIGLAAGTGGQKLTMNPGGTAPAWDNGKTVRAVLAGMSANDDPVLSEHDYTAVAVTTGAMNNMDLPDGTRLGFWILGAGQTLVPVGATDGVDIGCDQTDDEGIEVYSNAYNADGRPLAVGIDAAFYVLFKIAIQLANGSDDWIAGFRKVELINADAEAYNTYFGLGVNTAASPGALKTRNELNGGGADNTDTTDTIASATDLQIKILVSAAGVATLQHDAVTPGTLAAPSTPKAFTFDDGDQLMPYFRYLHATAAQAGTVVLKGWEVGLQ